MSRTLSGPGGPFHHEAMVRVANWATRVVLIAFVAVFTFTDRSPRGVDAAVDVAALAVAAVVLAVWVPADRLAPPRGHPQVRPYALGAMLAICAVASATPRGALFILLGAAAAIASGSDLGPRTGIAMVGLGTAATVVAGLALSAGASVTILYPLVLSLGFVFGWNLRAANLLREEQARAATLDERARIAREIHDVLAHSLGALGLQIQVARAVLTDQHDEARAVQLLEHAQRMATDGLNETRRAIHALRGQTRPLPDGLAEICANHQRRHGARVTFEVSGEPRSLAPDAHLALTRAAQEALVNAAKHAPRESVHVFLAYTDTDTSLTVRNRLASHGHDHGEAQLATVNAGYGLAGIRERLLLIDGTLGAGPQSDAWLVRVKVPQ